VNHIYYPLAQSSGRIFELETKIAKRFGFEQQLELPMPLPPQM
jgi:hypothetical protein